MDELSPAVSQAVTAPLSRAAIFLVMTVNPGADSRAAFRGLCADLSGLVRTVGFRDTEAGLTCVMGIGSEAWDRLLGNPRPKELHPFREFHSGPRHAPATPGDVLFHIRSKRMDLCFELAMQISTNLGDAAVTVDEVHGFRYFDDRDLMGFVDGTENPQGKLAADSTIIGSEDPDFAGSSYVIVQKYLHDLNAWNALSTEKQELVIGRRKLSDVELDEATKPTCAHSALTVIEENGQEVKILRDNMPFGSIAKGEFGTYFIGYSRSPRTIEQMLENMFIGRPPGNYDRILDFSTAVTGGSFFVPTATFLDDVADAPATDGTVAAAANLSVKAPASADGSLAIGSLKGQSNE